MRWDREVDVLIFGAGMGGMCAALFASLEGLDVLLCEKTDQVGGTTSTSAGTVWIPGSNQAKRDGVPDKIDDARRFLEAEIGPRALEAVREAFLQAGPAALDTLEASTDVKFIAPPMHPDYHSNQPGRALAGRALAPLPFDGRLLGKDFDRVRPPIAPFMVLGGMMVGKLDIPYLLKPFGSVANFMAASKLLLRHATDRLRFKRGTRLVMGNALVGRLFYSLRQRNVPIEYGAKLVELVKSNGRVEGAVVDIGDKRQTIRARRAVILATGGFGADTKMQKQYNANAPIEHATAFAGASGDGFKAGQAAGGAIDANHTMDSFYFPSSLNGEINFPHILLDRAKPGLIAVNKDGRRFVNESNSYHDFVEAMLRTNSVSPCIPAWLVCDRSFIRDYGIGLLHPGAGRRDDRALHRGRLPQARRDADGACRADRRRRQEPACAPFRNTIATPRPAWMKPSAKAAPSTISSTAIRRTSPTPACGRSSTRRTSRSRSTHPRWEPASGWQPTAMRGCWTSAASRSAASMRSATTWPRCSAASMSGPASRSAPLSCSPIGP